MLIEERVYNMEIGRVWTPGGVKTDLKRGLVGLGEVLYDYSTGESDTVTEGQYGKDTIPTNIGIDGRYNEGYSPELEAKDRTTAVAGNTPNIYLGGDTPAYWARQFDAIRKMNKAQEEKSVSKADKYSKLDSRYKETRNLLATEHGKLDREAEQGIQQVLEAQKANEEINEQGPMYANCGKNRYDSGLNLAIPTLASLGAGLAQLNYFRKQRPQLFNSYQAGPYTNQALSILANNRYDYRPAIQAVDDQTRRGIYQASQGGTAGQRYAAATANAIAAQRNMASIYDNAARQNMAQRNAYANSMLEADNRIQQLRNKATQFDREDYALQNRAYNSNLWKSVTNMLNPLYSYFNQIENRNLQNRTLSFYEQKLKRDNEWLKSLR